MIKKACLGRWIGYQASMSKTTIQGEIPNKSRTQKHIKFDPLSWCLPIYQAILMPKQSFGLEYEDKH